MYAKRWYRATELLTDKHGRIVADIAATAIPPSSARRAAAPAAVADPGGGGVAVLEAPPAPTPSPPPGPPPGPPDGPPPAQPPGAGAGDDPPPVDIREGLVLHPPPGSDPYESPASAREHADELMKRLSDADVESAYRDITENFQVLDNMNMSDPTTWPKPPATTHTDEVDNPHGQKVLERLIWEFGPKGIEKGQIDDLLALGGDWGPPVKVTPQTTHNWLKKAKYLADRQPRGPYVHKNRVQS
jgi:hypothetical protein